MKWIKCDSNNIVIEIVSEPDANTEYTVILNDPVDAKLGWYFNGVDFLPPKWTSYEFLLRLTGEERGDIRERAKTDPNVADFLMLAQSAQEIISNDPITLMGMNYLVSIGVFTEQRKKEILQILE